MSFIQFYFPNEGRGTLSRSQRIHDHFRKIEIRDCRAEYFEEDLFVVEVRVPRCHVISINCDPITRALGNFELLYHQTKNIQIIFWHEFAFLENGVRNHIFRAFGVEVEGKPLR